MMSARIRCVWLSACVVLLAACGSDKRTGPNGVDPRSLADSSFTATVAGGLSASLAGGAVYADTTDSLGNPVFGFGLGLGTQTGAIVLLTPSASSPSAGTYTIIDGTGNTPPTSGQFVAVDALGPTCSSCSPTAAFAAESGTVTITQISGTQILGTFSFSGVGASTSTPNNKVNVTVTGAFRAAAATGSAGGCGGAKCDVAGALRALRVNRGWR